VTGGDAAVLVVDDDPLNRRLLCSRVEQEGHRTATADNGVEALAMLSAVPFDAVLLDLEMPELDGYETLARIAVDDRLRHIPVIMVSGVDDFAAVLRCIEAGAADYLLKPFNPALLRARLGACIAKKRLQDLQLDYIAEVGRIAAAAAAVEEDRFDRAALDGVAGRDDALGQLARVFTRMAVEVQARERRLREEVRQLRIEINESRAALQVAEITDTDYFRALQSRADDLRMRG
jgi:two-component system cell cycle response regulator